ncbi:hypothetical protein AQB9606_01516 [Aquabacterium sp. CECT 9606]|nr:hypothetical protein AQB9606_01516 [Aquabacterium sp. CECT 9606]
MRVMVMVKATSQSEAGEMPRTELMAAMGNFNEELVKAGLLLAGEGLHPSARGKRVQFSGSQRSVTDGPFAETKELGQAVPQPDGRRFRDRDSATVRGGRFRC